MDQVYVVLLMDRGPTRGDMEFARDHWRLRICVARFASLIFIGSATHSSRGELLI